MGDTESGQCDSPVVRPDQVFLKVRHRPAQCTSLRYLLYAQQFGNPFFTAIFGTFGSTMGTLCQRVLKSSLSQTPSPGLPLVWSNPNRCPTPCLALTWYSIMACQVADPFFSTPWQQDEDTPFCPRMRIQSSLGTQTFVWVLVLFALRKQSKKAKLAECHCRRPNVRIRAKIFRTP